MEVYEGAEPNEPWGAYGFSLAHKHIPEMKEYSTLKTMPVCILVCTNVGTS